MERRFALTFAMGICLFSMGCYGFGGTKICGPSKCGKRCTDCVPPYVPTCKYKQWLDDYVTHETGKKCGKHALARYRKQTGANLSCDFGAGFVQAYVDLAEARSPLPPSVPPSRYWTAYYRSCAGRPCVEDWYAGYNIGLEEGLQSGVSQFGRVEVRMAGCQ